MHPLDIRYNLCTILQKRTIHLVHYFAKTYNISKSYITALDTPDLVPFILNPTVFR